MRRKTIWIVCLVSSAYALCSTWAQAETPTVVTRKAGHLLTSDAWPAAPETGESVRDQIKLYPVSTNELQVVSNVSGGVAVADKLIYDNPMGDAIAELPPGFLVADDIKVAVEDGCELTRFRFQVIGKAHDRACGPVGTPCTPVTFDYALYAECPGAGGAQIPGTNGCLSSDPARFDCTTIDTETLTDAVIVVPPGTVSLPASVWLGVTSSRSGAGVVVGAPAQMGYSSDVLDTLNYPCNSNLGGFPRFPHASFNASIWGDQTCAGTCLTYQNIRANEAGVNRGADVCLADDILLNHTCDMVEMEVGVRNKGRYDIELRQSFNSQPVGPCNGRADIGTTYGIAGTKKTFLVSRDGLSVRRFVFPEPIPLRSPNLFAVMSISTIGGQWIMTRRNASVGDTVGSYMVYRNGEWNSEIPADNSHGAMHFTITCANACPVGACCDQYIRDENDQAVCRDLPEINCPFPQKGSALKPAWEQGESCKVCDGGARSGLGCADDNDCDQPVCSTGPNVGFPCTTNLQCGVCRGDGFTPCTTDSDCQQFPVDRSCNRGLCTAGTCQPNEPFRLPCGLSACCKPDGDCSNLTKTDCSYVLPLYKPRVWQLGQFCSLEAQRCPNPACLEAEGDCMTARPKVCNGGADAGAVCEGDADCAGNNDGTCDTIQQPICIGGDHDGANCVNDLDCIPGGYCAESLCTGGARAGELCREPRDCAESYCEGHPGCANPFCCDTVCSYAPGPNLYTEFCCEIDWDYFCADLAQDYCLDPPGNNGCAPSDRVPGATEVEVNGTYVQTNSSRATNEPGQPGYCCNTGISRCDGGCADGDQCIDDVDCRGEADGYCNITLDPPQGLCTDGCNRNVFCLGGDEGVLETECVGGSNNGLPCMPRCADGDRIGEGCGNDGDCPYSGTCSGTTCVGGPFHGQSCSQPADCVGTALCTGDFDCPGGLCDNSFCEGAPDGFCADPTPEPGGLGYGSVWYYFTVPLETGTTTANIEVSTCGSGAPALDSMLQVFSIGDSDKGYCLDLGECADASPCSVTLQNCTDLSACVATAQECSVSGQDCPGGATCRLDKKAACDSVSVIGCNDDAGAAACGSISQARNSKLCLPDLIRGNTYYVMVSAKTPADHGSYRLRVKTVNVCDDYEPGACVTSFCNGGANNDLPCDTDADCAFPVRPLNDYCAKAFDLVDDNGDLTIVEPFLLDGASYDCGDPRCNSNLKNDVWYHVVAPVSGDMKVSTCGATPQTSSDTELMIYDGCECPPALVPTPVCASASNNLDCLTSAEGTASVIAGECYTIRLGDNNGNGATGDMTVTFTLACGDGFCDTGINENCENCVEDCPCGDNEACDAGVCVFVPPTCPPGTIAAADPPNGTVDAGYPTDDTCTIAAGLRTFTLTGPANADTGCWSVCDTSGGAAPGIQSVVESVPGTYTITLDRPITAGACTSITYYSTESQNYIALPGDVGADGASTAADVLVLIDVLNGRSVAPFGEYSTDVDRSGASNAADILAVIDLLNGAGCFDRWNNVSAPLTCGPCVGP